MTKVLKPQFSFLPLSLLPMFTQTRHEGYFLWHNKHLCKLRHKKAITKSIKNNIFSKVGKVGQNNKIEWEFLQYDISSENGIVFNLNVNG